MRHARRDGHLLDAHLRRPRRLAHLPPPPQARRCRVRRPPRRRAQAAAPPRRLAQLRRVRLALPASARLAPHGAR
eukprot:1201521-Prymnesium_polylepis.1